jgi:alpha-L-fucosidase 2
MLIQSHDGYIEFLPSIPNTWKASGAVKGMRARGNYTVDFAWKNGKITNYKITSPLSKKVKIKINGVVKEVTATRV